MVGVELYIYDLSNGLAKQVSLGLIGKQIEAIYHTSIVMDNIEYVYDGGIKAVSAGKTHLGPPMRMEFLGNTELPEDVITEFLEALRETYTKDTYDVWTHNCNNFSNDFAKLLLGKGIPSYISNLPQAVLGTPFGKLMKPHIDQIVRQAQADKGGLVGINNSSKQVDPDEAMSNVKNVSSSIEFDTYLQDAAKSCCIVFFTSPSCSPCRGLYPIYHELAARSGGKAACILVDITRNREIGMKYSITATPTFITFLKGEQENRWTGSVPATLRGNFDLLLRIAWPSHPHEALSLPILSSANNQPVSFARLPPLEKLKVKLGSFVQEAGVQDILRFISTRSESHTQEISLPDLDSFNKSLENSLSNLAPPDLFAVADLLRVCTVDQKLYSYYTDEKGQKTLASLFSHVNSLENCPYSLRLITTQLACNIFTNYSYSLSFSSFPSMIRSIVQLVTTGLLDEQNTNVRVAAAGLAFNISRIARTTRSEEKHAVPSEAQQVELVASLLEAISLEETSPEAFKGYLLALSNFSFCIPPDCELVELLNVMEAQNIVLSKLQQFQEPLVDEVREILLGIKLN
ncbi:BgTH12-07098 [Blumeria graminis f. sp. triticale]|uniref:BgTH12-07098 n=1 Tax=Blumeria graminis f. sp. triticale TaxID=1689686 RepID=A0A9W4GIR8_BLUGR|nr:BgTH12-07098 [Blumeria graminis f. sp. triticale]